jgi:hypothetical protein
MAEELWHYVEARRDDGVASMFRIRDLAPRPDLPKINVVELPYTTTELSRLPSAAAHRRLAEFEEMWLRPACNALGCELVGTKTEDGSCFYYMYAAIGPDSLIEKLSPFDAALGFYDDDDPTWGEYGTLRELLDQAKAIPDHDDHDDHDHDHAAPKPAKAKPKPKAKAKAKATPKRAPKPVARKPKATPRKKTTGGTRRTKKRR